MRLRLPADKASDPKEKVIAVYRELTKRLNEMLQNDRFNGLKSRFISTYLTNLKILDLLIWQVK